MKQETRVVKICNIFYLFFLILILALETHFKTRSQPNFVDDYMY